MPESRTLLEGMLLNFGAVGAEFRAWGSVVSRALGLGFGSCGCRGRFWWSLWLCLSGTWAPWKFKVSYSATESHCERPTSQDIPTRPKASDHETLARRAVDVGLSKSIS